jgi:hypothetical protein
VACGPTCAVALLPMRAACTGFLETIGMAEMVAAAAATCPATTPAAPCTSYLECGAGRPRARHPPPARRHRLPHLGHRTAEPPRQV